MKINIVLDKDIVKIEFEEQDIKDVELDLNGSINFTNLVLILSECKELLVMNPIDVDAFCVDNNINEFNKKVIEYLFKILNEFNKSYKSIFTIEENNEETVEMEA